MLKPREYEALAEKARLIYEELRSGRGVDHEGEANECAQACSWLAFGLWQGLARTATVRAAELRAKGDER